MGKAQSKTDKIPFGVARKARQDMSWRCSSFNFCFNQLVVGGLFFFVGVLFVCFFFVFLFTQNKKKMKKKERNLTANKTKGSPV